MTTTIDLGRDDTVDRFGVADEPEAIRWQGYVEADAEVSYKVAFDAGIPASVELCGHDSDVDLWIADETGRIVAESREADGREFCCFTPEETGLYTIWIENWLCPTGTAFELTVV